MIILLFRFACYLNYAVLDSFHTHSDSRPPRAPLSHCKEYMHFINLYNTNVYAAVKYRMRIPWHQLEGRVL